MPAKKSFKASMIASSALLLAFLFGTVAAQEKSVAPGLNKFWEKPDMERAAVILEQEHPAIFKYRHAIVAALGLEPGTDVADIGAGSGFIAQLIAREVAPEGTVYAQEISRQHLDYIMKEAEQEGIENIKPVLGEHRSANLPENSVDLIITIRTYHHFEYPIDMLASIKSALRPDGRFVVIDRERIRGISSEWELGHWRGGKGTFTDEIIDAGFTLEKELPLIPGNYYLVFRHR